MNGLKGKQLLQRSIILSSVLLLVLIGAMAFAHFFKRRGRIG
ncbi:hypothetical protein [Peribacillus frigoritolerans]